MFRSTQGIRSLILAVAVLSASSLCSAEEAVQPVSLTTLKAASEQKKFTFIHFYRDQSDATRKSLDSLKSSLDDRSDKVAYVTVNITAPEEKETVARFNVSRSPMPFILAVAPNGAITGFSTTPVNKKWVADSLATPHMTECMKSMQSGKLVLLCVHGSDKATTPAGVQRFIADPHYQKRTVVVSMQTTDPQEIRFLKDLQIPATASGETTVVFMAPPAVLIGRFNGQVSENELGQKLHAAGKCCDDPNCKHNHHRGN